MCSSDALPSPSLINRDGCSAMRQACLTWHLQAAGCKLGGGAVSVAVGYIIDIDLQGKAWDTVATLPR